MLTPYFYITNYTCFFLVLQYCEKDKIMCVFVKLLKIVYNEIEN